MQLLYLSDKSLMLDVERYIIHNNRVREIAKNLV